MTMTFGALPWRTGRKVQRTLYDAADQLIGVMDTPELAAQVVAAVNGEAALRCIGSLILPGIGSDGKYANEPDFDFRMGVLDALQARLVHESGGQTVRVAVFVGRPL